MVNKTHIELIAHVVKMKYDWCSDILIILNAKYKSSSKKRKTACCVWVIEKLNNGVEK